MGLRINKLAKVSGTFTGTSTDPVVTINTSTSAINTGTNGFGTLTSGQIWIGSSGNAPVGQILSGAITVTNSGVTSLGSGVVSNANVNASAAIALSKLAALGNSLAVVTNGSGILAASTTTAAQIGYLNTTTSDVQTQINAKQATITGAASSVVSSNLSNSVAVITNGSGKLASSSVSATALGYTANLTSDAQTQLNAKLSISLGSLANGDIVYYNGSNWTNLPRGTNGQALYSTATSIQWNTPTINGIPVGGTANQYLAKNSGTDFDVSWYTLTLAQITDVTSTASEVNKLTGVTTTAAQFNYLNTATSDIQSQLNNKLANVLSNNALFIGNASNVPSVLAAGSNGQVLQIAAGVPTWSTIAGSGSVTSIDVSGGTTGLTTSGGPITTSGTITFAGTLITANGGTGFSSYTVGDLLQANTTTTFSKLASVAAGSLLISGGVGTVSLWSNSKLNWDNTNNVLKINTDGGGTPMRIHSGSASSGNQNAFIGYNSGNFTNTGLGNTGYGANTLIALTTGQQNTCLGRTNGNGITTGNNNTFVGDNVGSSTTTGSSNVLLGFNINAQSATSDDQLSIQNAIFGLSNSGSGTTKSTGFIGIYQVSPSYNLHVTGNINNANIFLVEENGGANILEIIEAGGVNKIGFFATAPAGQQSVNTILVNSVTSGGTLSTIANYTDLTTYSNDAAAIRNNFFRLTEKVLKLETALRNYGLAID